MSRFLLTGFGGVVVGAAFWIVLGWMAAEVFSKMPGGAREGGGAMAGFYLAGPVCGFIGLVLGGWVVWRLLADAGRTGAVTTGLVGLAVVLIVGTTIALQPTIAKPDDYPGQKAEFRVEVSFPTAVIDGLGEADEMVFQLRAGDGTDETPWLREQIRHEGGRVIVPGVFPIAAFPRTKLLAVMKNGEQVMCSTLTVEGEVGATTEWSGWQATERGILERWRLVVAERR